eukprot:scaffold15366_cov70-Phaeocystis_antarctica.AAC.5
MNAHKSRGAAASVGAGAALEPAAVPAVVPAAVPAVAVAVVAAVAAAAARAREACSATPGSRIHASSSALPTSAAAGQATSAHSSHSHSFRSGPPLHLCGNQGRCGRSARTMRMIGRGWPRLEAAPSLIWRWRGVLEGEASPKPLGGCFSHSLARHDCRCAQKDNVPCAGRLGEHIGACAEAVQHEPGGDASRVGAAEPRAADDASMPGMLVDREDAEHR